MHRAIFLSLLSLLLAPAALAGEKQAFETIQFSSEDGLQITADLYEAHPRTAPLIVLFHQAGWSRGEYREIAPRLNEMGYNCIAVDQRSGGEVNGVRNETAARAKKRKMNTKYVDALPDIRAALKQGREEYAEGKIIAWGSSYSAALVLRVAGHNPDAVDGVLAFAPGEYFKKQGKASDWITKGARGIDDPAFITSAKREKSQWAGIFQAIPKQHRNSFVPVTDGNHGSRALWNKFDDSGAYWTAVSDFLDEHFPTR